MYYFKNSRVQVNLAFILACLNMLENVQLNPLGRQRLYCSFQLLNVYYITFALVIDTLIAYNVV